MRAHDFLTERATSILFHYSSWPETDSLGASNKKRLSK